MMLNITKNYQCINLDKNIYQFIYRDEITDDRGKKLGIDLKKKYRTKKKIKKILKY